MDPNPYPKSDYGRNTNSPDVLIIGAGISGLCTAIDMIKGGQGRNFVIVEKGNQVGGTWNDNVYPGCCCDVLSHLYSYSFEPNNDWTREYPGQEEIQAYLIALAHKYSLYAHIRFSSSVSEARWDACSQKWRTTIQRSGQEIEIGEFYTMNSDFLVSAVGQLSSPKYPSIPGIDEFSGKIMHSSRWDWNYDLAGKRVGIIGTGATAAQIIPEIAPHVSSLTVYQRTPAWVMPRHDKPIKSLRRNMYRYIPFARRRYRASLMDFREKVFDAAVDPYSTAHNHVSMVSRQHMHTQLPLSDRRSAQLREVLTPNYPFSCKRIIVSDDYYPTLLEPNVILATQPIERITPSGMLMADGTHHDLDVLILATGFRTTDFLHPIRIYNSSGQSLSLIWEKRGPSAYLGITVPSLPNFGMLYGPNTNLAYNSLILQLEAQSLYINHLISTILDAKRKHASLVLDVRQDVCNSYNAEVQQRLANSTFADQRCTSWFKDAEGRITNNWCGSAIEYQKRVCAIDWSDYDISGSAAPDVARMGLVKWKRRVEETQISDRTLRLGAYAVAALVVVGSWIWWR